LVKPLRTSGVSSRASGGGRMKASLSLVKAAPIHQT
jgi:hypothetical protein